MENKSFWKNFIANKKLFWGVISSVLALLLIVTGIMLSTGNQPSYDMPGCKVQVITDGGMTLEGIGVYIYEDKAKTELISYARTDANGFAAFPVEIPDGSVVILENVPAGYDVAGNYPVTAAEVTINLSSKLLTEMTQITVGGIMFDFTVTDTDGTEYTLSELLKENSAVVLNLWYTGCQPCKAEFPYLQQAYDAYKNDIALLALNPVDGEDNAAVSAFKTENNLTFPMAKCDGKWTELVKNIAYPTTIIIDRYGMVSLMHTGSIDSAKTFEDAFAFFADENYMQTTVESISSLVTSGENEETQPGTTPETTTPTVPETTAPTVETVAPTVPETQAPTVPPVTTAPTEPPATTAPTEPPATTAPTEPPATTTPTTPPATTAPTEPPATTAPTTPPATTAPTEPPETVAPDAPLNTNGTLVNPDDAIIKAMETFETEVINPGEMQAYAIRGIGEAKVTIKDKTAYVIYNNKTYTPENGVVNLGKINREDPNSLTQIIIGNGGTAKTTYTVTFSHTAGTQANPIEYELNTTITTKPKKGNEQGIYYTYTASKAGTLTISIKSCTSDYGCGIAITTKTGTTIQEVVSSLEADSISIQLEANQQVEIVIAALPDSRNNYPKATIETTGKFA